MSEAVFGAPEFTALSGMKVRHREDGTVVVGMLNGFLDRDAVFAVEEWAQAKRDAELGRWRWPLNPNFVVYSGGSGYWRWAQVLDENTGEGSVAMTPRDARDGIGRFCEAARAFFEAHPESKPWHDAEQGEFWSVRHMGMVEVCQVSGGRFVGVDNTVGSRVSMPVTHHSITAAHRLVEEVAS